MVGPSGISVNKLMYMSNELGRTFDKWKWAIFMGQAEKESVPNFVGWREYLLMHTAQ